jgi:hypothetical protein
VSDAAGSSTLTLQEVNDIIAKAKSGGANPMLMGAQIFNGLGDNVTLSGDTLRLALTASALPITGPLTALLGAIENVSKVGAHVTSANSQEIETTLNGTRVRFKEEVSFDVSETSGAPALNNIAGVSAHHVFWIDIKGIQLKQNQGRWSVAVVTSMKTINFDLD